MKRLAFIVVAGLAVLLQLSLVPALRPFGVVPNLVLVVVVLTGLEGTASRSLWLALGGGLILDMVSGVNFGLWTGVLTLAALATGLMHRAGIEPRVGVASAIVAAGTIVMAGVIWAGLIPIVNNWPVGTMTGRLSVELVLNLGLTAGLRPLVRFMLGGA